MSNGPTPGERLFALLRVAFGDVPPDFAAGWDAQWEGARWECERLAEALGFADARAPADALAAEVMALRERVKRLVEVNDDECRWLRKEQGHLGARIEALEDRADGAGPPRRGGR